MFDPGYDYIDGMEEHRERMEQLRQDEDDERDAVKAEAE